MKLKLHLFTTDPTEFLKGNYRNAFATLDDRECVPDDWIYLTPFEVNINPDSSNITNQAVKDIEDKIDFVKAQASKELEKYQQQLNELKAMTFNPENTNEY